MWFTCSAMFDGVGSNEDTQTNSGISRDLIRSIITLP